MTARRFPVHSDDRRTVEGCPVSVPWSLLAPHEEWAQWNHSQSLERLASRGGLGLHEMCCVIEHRKLWPLRPDADCLRLLRAHLLRWHDAMQLAERCLTCERAYPDCDCTGGPLVDWRQG